MRIFKEFTFEAAHFLPKVPTDHKCHRLHGHSYRVVLHLSGTLDPETGWLMDFGTIKEAVSPVIAQLDHHLLNDVAGLENPTCEEMARWMWRFLKVKLSLLSLVDVWETATCGASYGGEDE